MSAENHDGSGLSSSVTPVSSSPMEGDVDIQIRALKQRTTGKNISGAEKAFHYDENEPLRLLPHSEQTKKD